MTPRQKLTAFRLDDDLLVRLAAAAAKDDRPLSYVIRQACREWLERRESSKPERKRAVTRKRSLRA